MRITMYLLRPRASLAKEILRRHEQYHERPLRQPADDTLAWRLFVHPGFEAEVKWLKHLRPLLGPTDDDQPIRARSAGAVLLDRKSVV